MKKEKKVKTDETNKNQTNPEVESLRAQVARALADYDNLQKRVARDREESKYLSKLVLVARFLPVFDMFADAQSHLGDAGLGIALKVLQDTLKEEGIEEIESKVGDTFDENLHEAIDTVTGTEENDKTIAEVSLKGYKFTDGPVVRHAKVKVYKQSL